MNNLIHKVKNPQRTGFSELCTIGLCLETVKCFVNTISFAFLYDNFRNRNKMENQTICDVDCFHFSKCSNPEKHVNQYLYWILDFRLTLQNLQKWKDSFRQQQSFHLGINGCKIMRWMRFTYIALLKKGTITPSFILILMCICLFSLNKNLV